MLCNVISKFFYKIKIKNFVIPKLQRFLRSVSAGLGRSVPVGAGAGTGSSRCRPVPVPLTDRKKRCINKKAKKNIHKDIVIKYTVIIEM